MALYPFEHSAVPRLNSISEKLYEINTEILANLETLPERTEMVERLIARCDGVALELNAIKMELGVSADGASASEMKSPEPSADGSELKP